MPAQVDQSDENWADGNQDSDRDRFAALDETPEARSLTSSDLTELAPEVDAVKSVIRGGVSDRNTNWGNALDPLQTSASTDLAPTGGDLDTDQYLARVAGEEAVGGTTPTPEQSVVEDLAVAAGIEIPDKASLHTNDMLEQRDSHRWELEPESAEDFEDRD